jgi:hypothetical protein
MTRLREAFVIGVVLRALQKENREAIMGMMTDSIAVSERKRWVTSKDSYRFWMDLSSSQQTELIDCAIAMWELQ